MFIFSSLVITVGNIIQELLQLYIWIIIASAVLTWIEPNPYNPIVRFIYSITEPLFDWIRRRLPVFFGGIDFSPAVAIIGIILIQQWLIPNIQRVALTGFN